MVYRVYDQRPRAFEPAVQMLPADARVLGIVTSDDPETSLWRPFGSRRIMHVLAGESGEEIRRRDIKYVIVKAQQLKEPWPDWRQRVDARLLGTVKLQLRAGAEASEWRLVEMNPRPDSGPR